MALTPRFWGQGHRLVPGLFARHSLAVTTEVKRRLTPPERYRFGPSVRSLLVPGHDPCGLFRDDEFWLAIRTPEGAATLHLARAGGELHATGLGAGAAWVAERADAIAGLRDDVSTFAALAGRHPVVARLAKTFSGVRMPATGQVFPRLLRAILEQKVTGLEAHRSYRATCRHFGEPAPGPAGLVLPPDPAAVAARAYWEFHPFGVEQRRTQTLLRAAQVAERLDRCADSAEATARMTALPGIGPWTAAEVVRTAFGDPDAVSVGDYHIPNTVAYALAGEARGTDERMLELLEPFRGHRGRVCDLLAMGGLMAPRHGPRRPVRSFARF
ncbi:3-methyladenine DNA glycosylase/8-oxoguanine DNA glycosylase [Actinoplanes regularis]|uniref:3-methyladenine DNA glycosylase/8-oxoguanine DNA glycosylase n=1 Tax=Actinoplanes regularis TaxID=52697 RepID=A0A238UX07_9ACTN|nr:3-methyladenine DNA glycosylase [Actinoplanes regularis]SNR26411.1 3-methyladenine DNA glycosylase/8-oxoguanine DNA glycosylase [Actinoplanes regularis]